MPSSVLLRRVALVITDTAEERSVSIIRVTRIGELGKSLAVTSLNYFLRSVFRLLVSANIFPRPPILVTLMMEAIRCSVMSVLTRATRRHMPVDSILHGRTLLRSSKCGVRRRTKP
jgi:hypothetical protein